MKINMNKKIITYVIMALWLAMSIFCFITGYNFYRKTGEVQYYTIICWTLGGISLVMVALRYIQFRNDAKRKKSRYFTEQNNTSEKGDDNNK